METTFIVSTFCRPLCRSLFYYGVLDGKVRKMNSRWWSSEGSGGPKYHALARTIDFKQFTHIHHCRSCPKYQVPGSQRHTSHTYALGSLLQSVTIWSYVGPGTKFHYGEYEGNSLREPTLFRFLHIPAREPIPPGELGIPGKSEIPHIPRRIWQPRLP